MKFFPRLHWLRGLLALAVVASHTAHMISSPTTGLLSRMGSVAVPVFFVLSGFVMYGVVESSPAGFREALGFLVKRFMRIVPAYWFFLGLTALFVLSGHDTWDSARDPSINWQAGWTGFDTHEPYLKIPMLAAWSLFFEMIFYYVLTLVVWNRRLGIVALVLYFGWSILISNWVHIRLYGLSIINALFLGGLMLGAMNRYTPQILARLTSLLYIGLAGFLVFITLGYSFHGIFDRLFALLVVAGILGLEHAGKPRLQPVVENALQFLGTVSFSLYVGHTLTQSALVYLVGNPSGATVALFIVVPIFVAFCSFNLIEKPAMNLAKWIDAKIVRHAVRDVAATKDLKWRPS